MLELKELKQISLCHSHTDILLAQSLPAVRHYFLPPPPPSSAIAECAQLDGGWGELAGNMEHG